MKRIFLSAGLFAMLASNVAANNLVEDRRIRESFHAAAVADAIRKNCDTINGRVFYALQKALELKQYARDLGYSDEQIDDFVNDRNVQRHFDNLRDAYFAQKGVQAGDAESYCRLGEEEIRTRSLAGSLLVLER